MGHFVQLRAADGFESQAYLAQPKTQPRGAIVVLQEIFGVNSHIRAICDGFAFVGFLALAPATFSRVKKDVDLGYTASDVEIGRALKTWPRACPHPASWPMCKPPSAMLPWPPKARWVWWVTAGAAC